MKTMKSKAPIKWKMDPAPTGKYASFQKRMWPGAFYPDGTPAAQIYCDAPYEPARAKDGNHPPLRVHVADHGATPFKWRVMKEEFKTLLGAKLALEKFLSDFTGFQPKGGK